MSLSAITRARAAALLFGGTALGALPLPVRAQTSSTIRIATIPTENAAGPYYASDMGFFTKAGLDVEIQSLASAAAVAAAVSSGAVDVGYNAVDVLASIHQKNIPLVVLAPGGEYLVQRELQDRGDGRSGQLDCARWPKISTARSSPPTDCARSAKRQRASGSTRTAAIQRPASMSRFRSPRCRPRSTPAASMRR